MKVKCINNFNSKFKGYLTIGKIYNVIEIDSANDYWVINDKGYNWWFPKEWFKLLSEIRNEKIDKLLE